MSWHETSWHFVTSQGGEVTGGEVLNIGGTGGSFFLEDKNTGSRIELVYGALGVGIGAGIPISFDFSLQEFPSGGLGNIMARNRRRLHPEDFGGVFVMGNLQYAAIIEGKMLAKIFFNVPVLSSAPPAASAKASGVIWGANAGIQLGAGAMYYIGYLDVV